jgi:response regulator RpfG family c-di-GMP phosphodiesterase
MTERILCVDDDANILLGYQRALRKRFQIEAALGGEEGLAAIRDQGPYAVVVADMRMPGMNGVELLTQTRQIAPDTVRMMLTGNSDQQTALEAVNEGHIFRFMSKPCAPENFAKALEAGLAQYRLIVAERELLSKTLSGSIKMLTDVLSLASPTAFGRASRVRGLARKMAQLLGEREVWMIEIAAMLSQVGCVAIPDEVLARHYCGEELSRSEKEAIAVHPLVGRDLLKSIPRLEGVAEIIGYQEKQFDGEGIPADDCRGKAIPAGSRILKVALDFDALVSTGLDAEMALGQIQHRVGVYDSDMVAALQKAVNVSQAYVIRQVKLDELKDGMILANDMRSLQGTLLCSKGHEVNPALRVRLRNYVCNVGLRGAIEVFMPLDFTDEEPKMPDGLTDPEALGALSACKPNAQVNR